MTQSVQKILGNGRISLPQEWLDIVKAKEGDLVIVDFDSKALKVQLAEVRPR